jgi:predicted Zn-dependent protease
MAEYLHAIELDPEDPSSWRVLALFCASNGYELSDTGLQAAKTLLQLAPDDWQSPDTAGQVNLALGDIDEAQQQFEEAIMLSPRQPEPHLHLALVHLELGNGSMARQELETTCNLDPDGAACWQAGRLLEQLFP